MLKWSESELDISLNHDIVVNVNPQISGQLGQWNSTRVHTLYGLETAYQWLKHLVCLLCIWEAV
jgi:hypothetical protein